MPQGFHTCRAHALCVKLARSLTPHLLTCCCHHMVVGQFTRRAAEQYAARCLHDVPLDKVVEMLEQWWDENGGAASRRRSNWMPPVMRNTVTDRKVGGGRKVYTFCRYICRYIFCRSPSDLPDLACCGKPENKSNSAASATIRLVPCRDEEK